MADDSAAAATASMPWGASCSACCMLIAAFTFCYEKSPVGSCFVDCRFHVRNVLVDHDGCGAMRERRRAT